ncbi:HYR domain-containing protein, partial [Candidatus Ulvibacter alkanivorans]|uniref:HYR domain-containing protein n=1 Tax=Candidatus Ulvibacter alkanivorans TaxID=2267620 RepID=UPI00109C02E8
MKRITLLVMLLVGFISFGQGDTCATATTLTNGTFSGSTVGASNNPTPFCGTSDGSGGDVWYTFTDASGSGFTVDLTTCSSNTNYDTKLRVYSGNCGGLNCVTGDDDDPSCPTSGLQSTVNFTTDGSSTYYVKVHGFGSSEGNFDLTASGIVIGAPPIIACPMDIVANNDPGVCGAVVNFADAVAVDPEDGPLAVTQTAGGASGTVFPIGDTTVTFEATDSDGNTSMCSFTVTIIDNEDPTIACAADQTQTNDPGMCGADVVVVPPTPMDNCPTASAPVVAGPVTAMNFSGGDLVDTPSTVMGLSNSVGGDVSVDVTWTGDFGFSTETFALEGPDGSVVLSVPGGQTGDCGQFSSSFAVNETTWNGWITTFGTDLTFTLQGDPDVDLFCALNEFQLTATLGMGATLVNDYTGTDDASAFYPVGTTTVTWTFTDPSGNSVDCTQDITVTDDEAPVIVCQGEQTVPPLIASAAPGTPITDNATFSETLTVSEDYNITDLNVDMDITHTWTGDITITLESPAGTIVTVFDDIDGCSANDITTLFDDESANALDCDP